MDCLIDAPFSAAATAPLKRDINWISDLVAMICHLKYFYNHLEKNACQTPCSSRARESYGTPMVLLPRSEMSAPRLCYSSHNIYHMASPNPHSETLLIMMILADFRQSLCITGSVLNFLSSHFGRLEAARLEIANPHHRFPNSGWRIIWKIIWIGLSLD